MKSSSKGKSKVCQLKSCLAQCGSVNDRQARNVTWEDEQYEKEFFGIPFLSPKPKNSLSKPVKDTRNTPEIPDKETLAKRARADVRETPNDSYNDCVVDQGVMCAEINREFERVKNWWAKFELETAEQAVDEPDTFQPWNLKARTRAITAIAQMQYSICQLKNEKDKMALYEIDRTFAPDEANHLEQVLRDFQALLTNTYLFNVCPGGVDDDLEEYRLELTEKVALVNFQKHELLLGISAKALDEAEKTVESKNRRHDEIKDKMATLGLGKVELLEHIDYLQQQVSDLEEYKVNANAALGNIVEIFHRRSSKLDDKPKQARPSFVTITGKVCSVFKKTQAKTQASKDDEKVSEYRLRYGDSSDPWIGEEEKSSDDVYASLSAPGNRKGGFLALDSKPQDAYFSPQSPITPSDEDEAEAEVRSHVTSHLVDHEALFQAFLSRPPLTPEEHRSMILADAYTRLTGEPQPTDGQYHLATPRTTIGSNGDRSDTEPESPTPRFITHRSDSPTPGGNASLPEVHFGPLTESPSSAESPPMPDVTTSPMTMSPSSEDSATTPDFCTSPLTELSTSPMPEVRTRSTTKSPEVYNSPMAEPPSSPTPKVRTISMAMSLAAPDSATTFDLQTSPMTGPSSSRNRALNPAIENVPSEDNIYSTTAGRIKVKPIRKN